MIFSKLSSTSTCSNFGIIPPHFYARARSFLRVGSFCSGFFVCSGSCLSWERMEPMLSLPGLEIYPDKRKVFRDRQEIRLTTKEYEILLLLAANKGHVLTYSQIYEKVWGDCPSGSENNTIGFHICNLREKLYEAAPNAPFTIRSVREVGYCFEIQAEK